MNATVSIMTFCNDLIIYYIYFTVFLFAVKMYCVEVKV